MKFKFGDLVVVTWPGYGRFRGRVYMVDALERRLGVLTPTGTGVAFPARACRPAESDAPGEAPSVGSPPGVLTRRCEAYTPRGEAMQGREVRPGHGRPGRSPRS